MLSVVPEHSLIALRVCDNLLHQHKQIHAQQQCLDSRVGSVNALTQERDGHLLDVVLGPIHWLQEGQYASIHDRKGQHMSMEVLWHSNSSSRHGLCNDYIQHAAVPDRQLVVRQAER